MTKQRSIVFSAALSISFLCLSPSYGADASNSLAIPVGAGFNRFAPTLIDSTAGQRSAEPTRSIGWNLVLLHEVAAPIAALNPVAGLNLEGQRTAPKQDSMGFSTASLTVAAGLLGLVLLLAGGLLRRTGKLVHNQSPSK